MTNQEIKTVGQTIAAETQIGGNTAARVGGVVEGIGDALDNKDAAVGYYLATMSGSTIYVNSPNYRLGTGGNMRVKMPAAATTACTLTVGNANAVTLWYNGAAVSADNSWEAGEIITVFYDGTRFMASNSQGGGGQFGSGEKIKDILLSQTLGAGTGTITSQKGVSDAIFNEIDISSIDTLKTLNDALAPSSSLKPTYYTVTAMLSSVKLKVGSMAVISDNMRHVVTQIMATHYLLDDAGNLTNEHSDAEIFFIYRSVKLSGGTLPDPAGVWTKWRYVNASVWSTSAEKIKYDNSLNWYTEDNVQRVVDELMEDDYNLLNALGMTTIAEVITINAQRNTVTNYTYNIRKGDRFRVKTVYGSGVAYANVSTRVNGVVEERIIQGQSTGQDILFEALHDADDFSIYSSRGATTVTIYPIAKDINPSYNDVFSPTFIEGSLAGGTYQRAGSSSSYYKKRIIAVAKAGKKMKITTQEGYYCSIHEYSAEYTSPTDLTNSTWLGYTHEWFTGELEFTTLDATKTIALVCGKGVNKDQVIAPAEGVNFEVESAYTINQILPVISQKINNAEIQLLGIQEAQKTIPVTLSLGVWNSNTGEWGTTTTRIASPQIPVDGSTLKFKMDVGFKYSLTLYDENKNILSSITDLWNESDGQYHELKGLHGFLTFNIAYNDDRTIGTIPDFGFELISMGDHTSIGRETDFKTKYNGSRFFYTGAPITLQKRNYWLRYIWGYPVPSSFQQQGMAIHGNVAIIGSATQSGTNVKAEAFNISDFSKLASMLLPRGGYSDLHCNVMCFGNVMGSGNLPSLYVSQWNQQNGCFVYDIASNYAATLQQVILPTNVSSDLIGAGNIDWIVDTDNNRLISIGYVDNTDVLTASNGMQVCVFQLPALTESVVNLTDADVLDSFHIDEFYVRQDCCYNNGNIYMMCGASNTLDYTKIAVINLAGRNVASVIDLKWLPYEPEGIDVYDNSLFIRVYNNRQMYRLYFD